MKKMIPLLSTTCVLFRIVLGSLFNLWFHNMCAITVQNTWDYHCNSRNNRWFSGIYKKVLQQIFWNIKDAFMYNWRIYSHFYMKILILSDLRFIYSLLQSLRTSIKKIPEGIFRTMRQSKWKNIEMPKIIINIATKRPLSKIIWQFHDFQTVVKRFSSKVSK